ncbi:hypothetical protein L873DRAFT_1813480 [Choiromyces venosus 120613-1]|uniref:Uncharacterized protein n=1 Tax=Choiromyces venosus 120613-1 TaxID=1336337 RepID=A0A3N4JM26_9PEZI|nr:hypothetical protein L873DRAFT_1813480 [Choiromyces venosus 120613-1]
MSYQVMPDDLLPGGDSLDKSPPGRSSRATKPINSPLPNGTVRPYIPVLPRDFPNSATPISSRKKDKKWVPLPLAGPDPVPVRDLNESQNFPAQSQKEGMVNERPVGMDSIVQEQAVESSVFNMETFGGRRVSIPVTIRNPVDMSEIELGKLVVPSATKRSSTYKSVNKIEAKRVDPPGPSRSKAPSDLAEPQLASLLDGSESDEERFFRVSLDWGRAGTITGARGGVPDAAGFEGLNGNRLHGTTSIWGSNVPSVGSPHKYFKHEDSPTKQAPNSGQIAMSHSNGYGPIRRPQAEPVDGKMLATYLEDHRGDPADPANPTPSMTHRLSVLEDAFRKLAASISIPNISCEDIEIFTKELERKVVSEISALRADFQTPQNTMANIISRQDEVEDAIIARLQEFEGALVRAIGAQRQLREDFEIVQADFLQLRYRIDHLLNPRTYGGNFPRPGHQG